MNEVARRLFMGIKISSKVQNELDHCAPGTECYFKEDKLEYLHFLTLGRKSSLGDSCETVFP